jgi:DNA-binding transcriptional LysR family regulator
MELRQLEYLVAVVEEGGFTRAADRVQISQSGVSAQIRQLERELGQLLLDRSGRTVTTTVAGQAVLPFARAALAAVAGAREAADELAGLVRGRVTVGMVTGCALPGFFAALAAFHRAHPQVEVSLVERSSADLVEAVAGGRLDLVVAGVHGPARPGLERLVLVDEPLVAAVGPDSPLAGRRSVGLAALAEETLICLPEGAGVRAAFDEGCVRAGLAPAVALEASSPTVVADLAARGLGVAVLSASMLDGRADLTQVPISGPCPPARLEVLWRSPEVAGPAARRLADVVRAELGGAGR